VLSRRLSERAACAPRSDARPQTAHPETVRIVDPIEETAMSDFPAWTQDEINAFAARYGLANLTPDHLARMRELADRVSAAGRAIPRMPSKGDEPASTFRVPLA